MRRFRVLRPIRSIEEVLASLEVFGGAIAGRLDERREPAEDGADFSYRQVFDDLGRDLEALRRDLVAADDEHLRRQVRASDLGRRCEELRRDLYDQQVAVRRILSGAFDPARNFELAAISGTTPRTLKALEEQVDQTVKLLRDPVDDVPEVKVVGVEIDLGRMADGLEARLIELRTARQTLERARKAVVESKVDLDRSLAEVRGRFPWIARTLESYARMAGEPELAGRIRTSIRRVTRRQAEPRQAEPAEEGDPAATSETTAGSESTASAETAAEVGATSETQEATGSESAAPIATSSQTDRDRILSLVREPGAEERERRARSRS